MPSTRIPWSKEGLNKISGKTIDILVGKDREVFSVHEKLICANSPFFEKAMAGGWAESLTRTVEMPDDEPGTFAFYIFWLYYGSLPVFEAKYTFSRDVNLLSLVKAYVLGDKLLDDNFQDATIDFIIEGRDQSRSPPGWLPVGEVIEYTYKNTRKSSPLRRLFLDMYAREGYPEWLTDPSWGDASQIPQPFLFDLALKQMSDTIKFDFTPGYLVESSRYYVGSRVVADEDDSSEDD